MNHPMTPKERTRIAEREMKPAMIPGREQAFGTALLSAVLDLCSFFDAVLAYRLALGAIGSCTEAQITKFSEAQNAADLAFKKFRDSRFAMVRDYLRVMEAHGPFRAFYKAPYAMGQQQLCWNHVGWDPADLRVAGIVTDIVTDRGCAGPERKIQHDMERVLIKGALAFVDSMTPNRRVLKAASAFRNKGDIYPNSVWLDDTGITDSDLRNYRLPSWHPLN